MSDSFNAYGKYYDLFYKDKDYPAEANYIVNKLREFVPEANSILELGSGTGKHAHLLGDKGYTVHGIEKSAKMIAASKSKNVPGFSCTLGDITSFQLDQKFDAAISLFHVISYLTDNKQLIAAFQNIYSHLYKNAVFIFDVWYSPAVYYQVPEKRLKEISDGNFTVTRIAIPEIFDNTNCVDVHYKISVNNNDTGETEIINEQHSMRHFSYPEIELAAVHTGFKLLAAEEFLSGNTPGKSTWGVCFILRKE